MMDELREYDGSIGSSPGIARPGESVEVPPDDETPVSVRVVEALAEMEGVSPVELETPLYESVDPETLDELVEPASGTSVHMEFAVDGYLVTVTAEGTVYVGNAE